MDEEGRWDESMCTALVESLGKLQKIQTLSIISNDAPADLEGSVKSLGNLRKLILRTTMLLPTWINPASLLFLSFLRIHVVVLDESKDFQVLGMLQALRFLEVSAALVAQATERPVVSPEAFPQLRVCRFPDLSMVPSMFPPGAMPRLEDIKFQIDLKDIEDGKINVDDLALGDLPSLQCVQMSLYGGDRYNGEVISEVRERVYQEAYVHPNHPSVSFPLFYED
ncbi:unnamed protein product [Urochloa humidicola]